MLPKQIENLVAEIAKLPGLGQRQATRLAFHLLSLPPSVRKNLSVAIEKLKEIKTCRNCFNFAADNLCIFCRDKNRDEKTICVVEDMLDIVPIERTGQYKGVYHILGGLVSPLDGLTPDKLKIRELVGRVKKDSIKEIILALNPSVEGDTTALYIERALKNLPVRMTRLARGLATGSDLEYTDTDTLSEAISGRK